MKTLTKIIAGAAFMGLMEFGSTAYTQGQDLEKKDSLSQINPWSNDKFKFYYNILEPLPNGEKYTWENLSFYKAIYTRICNCQEEENKGNIFINYFDQDNDGFYEHIYILNPVVHYLHITENFRFYKQDKTMDYQLEFTSKNTEKKLKKGYSKITTKEAQDLDKEFIERVNKIVNAQNDFNRFNTAPIDNLLREEAGQWEPKKERIYRFEKTGFPIYKFFTDEEKKKLEEIISETMNKN